jgi:MFS family permease
MTVVDQPKRGERGRGARQLTPEEKRVLALLGVPTFALALGITVVSTYMPVVARDFTTSNVVIGVIIGAEGLVALWLPLIVGTWSDQLQTRWGGRIPFLLVGTPVAAAALAAMAVVGSIVSMAVLVTIFFVGYFVAYEPYRAQYPDSVPDEVAGRAQSSQAIWRGVGTGVALLGGGLLLGLARPLPFVVAAGVLLVSMGGFTRAVVGRGAARSRRGAGSRSVREEIRHLRRLVGERPALRSFLGANALWEASLAALKSFVVLYLTRGLGYSTTASSLIIGVTAVFILMAAAVSGRLADRYGRARVIRWVIPFYGLGLLLPFFFTDRPLLIATVPFVAMGGGFIMSLPYAIVQPLMPDGEHGAVTGYYTLSRGIGTALGPLLAGIAVNWIPTTASGTGGYASMWLICSITILLSLPFMRRLERCERELPRP